LCGPSPILTLDGGKTTPPTTLHSEVVLLKALVRSLRWQELLDRGFYGSVTEFAEAEKISKSYVRCGNRAGPQPSLGSGCPSR
jgi:hypothetical protein